MTHKNSNKTGIKATVFITDLSFVSVSFTVSSLL